MDFCKEGPRLVYLTSYRRNGEVRDELIISGFHDDIYYSADIHRNRTIVVDREIYREDPETWKVLEHRRIRTTYFFTAAGTFKKLSEEELDEDQY